MARRHAIKFPSKTELAFRKEVREIEDYFKSNEIILSHLSLYKKFKYRGRSVLNHIIKKHNL
jgi:hypothetical protein